MSASHVQSVSNSTPVGATLVATLTGVASGAVLKVAVCRDSSQAFVSIADTALSSYGSSVQTASDVGNGEKADCWVAVAGGTGSITVTVTHAGTLGDGAITFTELAGVDTTTPVRASDNFAGNSGTSVDGISVGPQTATAGDAITLFVVDTSVLQVNNFSPGTNYTQGTETGDGTNLDAALMFRNNVPAGSQSALATAANNNSTLGLMVVFRLATGGGATNWGPRLAQQLNRVVQNAA